MVQKLGQWCGSVGRSDVSNSKGLQFESSHWPIFIINILTVNCWKDENKQKDNGNSSFFRLFTKYEVYVSEIYLFRVQGSECNTQRDWRHLKLFPGRWEEFLKFAIFGWNSKQFFKLKWSTEVPWGVASCLTPPNQITKNPELIPLNVYYKRTSMKNLSN